MPFTRLLDRAFVREHLHAFAASMVGLLVPALERLAGAAEGARVGRAAAALSPVRARLAVGPSERVRCSLVLPRATAPEAEDVSDAAQPEASPSEGRQQSLLAVPAAAAVAHAA